MKSSKCVEVWVVEIRTEKKVRMIIFDSQEEMNDWLSSREARKIAQDHGVEINFWQI